VSRPDSASLAQCLLLLDGLARKAGHYVALMKPPAWVREVGSITVVNSGIPSDSFNCVISRELAEPEGAPAIDEICSTFNAAGLPAAWWTCDGIRADFIPAALARHHFVEDETDVGMLADLDPAPPPQPMPAGFEVRVVDSAPGAREMGRLLSSLSDPPDPGTMAYYTAVSGLGVSAEGPMRLFLGYADGRPVSTASLYLDGEVGHIFDVSTPDALRGRGFGTAMMRAVLENARRAGARRAGLHASQEGIGVYRRTGFVEAGIFRVYSNKRYIAETRRV